MTGAKAALHDLSVWARGDLLVIVLLVLGAILLTRFAGWARDRFMAHIDARANDDDELVRSEAAKHRQVVAQVVTWTALAVIYVVAAVLIIQNLGVPWAGLVAPAALLSAALGFGLQRFVQDIGAGLFITGERQYGFGDVIHIAVAGVNQQVTGTVEDVTLRVTRIRSVSGEVITTPNGQIVQVTNLSRDWARAVIDVPVPSSVDVSHVTEVLRRVVEDAYNDERLRKMMLDPPTVMGVEKIEVDTFSVRMVARTLPGVQFDVGRELRARVASAFRPRGHQRLGRARHRPGDRGCLMSGRPRTSTLVISGLFLAVLALYILVRPVPPPASAGTTQSGATSSSTAPASPSTSPRPTQSPSPSHTVSPSATPTSTSPAPLGSPTAAPSAASPSPSAGSPTP